MYWRLISLVKIYYVHARIRYILLSHNSQALLRVWRTLATRVA
jgi:hypothetical protein